MAEQRRKVTNGSSDRGSGSTLEISGLNVYYGASHALQGVDLSLDSGVLSVVGRNGMGKTTLCKAIMGLVPVSSGSIRFRGIELAGQTPAAIARLGIGYVPQGRRLWRSLTVDEHLRLADGSGNWTRGRIYATFPRLAERRHNGGAQLSGGEQQMLAIARALLQNPDLLVMDEPTEGLAPVIVAQVEEMLLRLGEEGDVDVLVIEQNIGVATIVADEVAIMVNGRVTRRVDAGRLAADRALQQRLLGVGRHAEVADSAAESSGGSTEASIDDEDESLEARSPLDSSAASLRIYVSNPTVPNRWTPPVNPRLIEQAARTLTEEQPVGGHSHRHAPGATRGRANGEASVAAATNRDVILVAGTLDTKGTELRFIRDRLRARGHVVHLVDLSTTGESIGCEVPAHQVAALHPRGTSGVFTGDRGQSVAGMTVAFERWIERQGPVRGLIAAGGSGGTALVAPGMRRLPFGVPKVMISTVAAGNVSEYVGPSDMLMLHSVADVQGLNSITREVLANGADALAGMVEGRRDAPATVGAQPALPALGITMFGVTTTLVRQLVEALEAHHDCLVFHATGIGGRSMESLIDDGRIAAVLDMTTTEVCDRLVGGIFPAHEDRFGAMIRQRLPYIGACGALDMVNFAAPETVPERFASRTFYEHNPQVTLMRTTPEENSEMGRWIGERLNRMDAPVRFFLPEGGVSALDGPGRPFHDPAADAALFKALEQTVRQSGERRLVRVPHHINEPAFAEAVLDAFRELHGGARSATSTRRRHAR